jgi:hypothetical protein
MHIASLGDLEMIGVFCLLNSPPLPPGWALVLATGKEMFL